MKFGYIRLGISLLFTVMASTAQAGVWKQATPSSSGGSGASCYHVIFDAGTYGVRSLIGTGSVYGSVFTGFLWFPGLTSRSRYDCGQGAVGRCAWYGANIGDGSNSYSVAVSALPIHSAQPTGCY